MAVVALAPRYDVRLLRALSRLDDRSRPIAETCRRLGEVADALGLTRPSYVHVRRIVVAERARRDAVRALVDLTVGRIVHVREGLDLPPRETSPPGWILVALTASAARSQRRRAPPP